MSDKRKDEELTPEERAELERQFLEDNAKIEELTKKGKYRLPGMPDNPTYAEVKEWEAIVMPWKYQQMIDIYEKTALDTADIARLIEDPKERKAWLKRADKMQKELAEMRCKKGLIRMGAEQAQKELDELK